jgi:hypothetical protein
MKKSIILAICFITTVIVAAAPAMAMKYTIDGNLSDWGLGKLVTDSWAVNETWLPNAGVQFIVEDNYDPIYGKSPWGVHIKGSGSSFVKYDEPKMVRKGTLDEVLEPYGSPMEKFDVEAIYFDQDNEYIYVAIVTSLNPNEAGDLAPGDLALNMDGNKSTGKFGYEYGVKLGTYPHVEGIVQGDIVYLPDWQGEGYLLPEERPDIIIGGSKVGYAYVAYNNNWLTVIDNEEPNWVIEIAIPKSVVGGSTVPFSYIFYGDNCLNESIYVPEFPTIAVSAAMIMGIAFVVYRLKQKRNQ